MPDPNNNAFNPYATGENFFADPNNHEWAQQQQANYYRMLQQQAAMKELLGYNQKGTSAYDIISGIIRDNKAAARAARNLGFQFKPPVGTNLDVTSHPQYYTPQQFQMIKRYQPVYRNMSYDRYIGSLTPASKGLSSLAGFGMLGSTLPGGGAGYGTTGDAMAGQKIMENNYQQAQTYQPPRKELF